MQKEVRIIKVVTRRDLVMTLVSEEGTEYTYTLPRICSSLRSILRLKELVRITNPELGKSKEFTVRDGRLILDLDKLFLGKKLILTPVDGMKIKEITK